jgi:hypothetical protein
MLCACVCVGRDRVFTFRVGPGAQMVNDESHLNKVGCHSTIISHRSQNAETIMIKDAVLATKHYLIEPMPCRLNRYIRRIKHKTSVLTPYAPHPPDNNRSMLSLINLVLPVKSAFGYLLMTNSLIFLLVTVVRS